MIEKQQDSTIQKEPVSPLATDKSYGEKIYDTVFNNGINFWVNLFAAAAFSQWAAHGIGKVRLWGMKKADNPRGIQQFVADKLEKHVMPIFKPLLPKDKTLAQNAYATTEILTLQIPGHIVMIPSIWLGAKIKPAFVKHFNRKHYGEAADDDPTLLHRQAMVEAEAKPTLLGAVTARIASLGLAFGTSAVIGSENNKITEWGKKNKNALGNFPGLNAMAGKIGEGFGDGVVRAVPGMKGMNRGARKHLGWSEAQKATGASGPYNRAFQDFSRFTAMDVAYTWILSAGIHPIIAALRHVPGMTYTNRPPVEKHITNEAGEVTTLRAPKNRMADEVEQAPAANGAPAPINLSEIKHLDRVKPKSEQELHS